MKIVICGGGGFIGQRLARLLLDKGYEIVILDRNQSRVSSPKLQSFIVDLLNPKLLSLYVVPAYGKLHFFIAAALHPS